MESGGGVSEEPPPKRPSILKSSAPVPVKLPLLAPKPLKEKETEPVEFKAVDSTASRDIAAKPVTPATKQSATKSEIINEDVCSSCDGLGNFICCDACPRSFHFTCAEPPLDPQNLPEDDWYCNECRQQVQQHKSDQTIKEDDSGSGLGLGLWDLMTRSATRANPKCFVMPRRFRYQPKEEDLQKLLAGQLTMKNDRSSKNAALSAKEKDSALSVSPPPPQPQSNVRQTPQTTQSHKEIIISDTIKLDHCNIRAPNISLHKSTTGYCHCCGRFGLTRTALLKSDEDPSIPCDVRYHRPILSCSICPLYWHLDCLDPPMASFPGGDPTWTCPIHFTTEKCLALDLAESLVQSTMLLPESAIKLQFIRKVDRLRDDSIVDKRDKRDERDEEELVYGIRDSVIVPESVKRSY